MKFERQCTRYTDGKCRLTGYSCDIKREVGEPGSITSVREISCYWFTRDVTEGKRKMGKI